MNVKWLKVTCFTQILFLFSGCATTCYYIDKTGKHYTAEEVKRMSCATCSTDEQDQERIRSPIIGGDSSTDKAPIIGGDSAADNAPIIGGDSAADNAPIIGGDAISTNQSDIGDDIAEDDIKKLGFTKVCD